MWISPSQFSSVQFSRSVMSNFLQPHKSQHARPPCPSPTPRVHWDSRPSSQWCHPAISSSVAPFSFCPQSLPASESFPITLRMRWPKYWSFSFSIIPSKEIPGLISFRMDWLDLLAVPGTLKSLLQLHTHLSSFIMTEFILEITVSLDYQYLPGFNTVGAMIQKTVSIKSKQLLLFSKICTHYVDHCISKNTLIRIWVWFWVQSNQASLVAQMIKNTPAMQETQVPSLHHEDPLEKGMATHSSILAQRIPWTEEPGGLQSLGLQRARHNRGTNTFTFWI